jgi:hypothetical protein
VTPSHVTAEFLASVFVRFWWRAGLFKKKSSALVSFGWGLCGKNCVAHSTRVRLVLALQADLRKLVAPRAPPAIQTGKPIAASGFQVPKVPKDARQP